MSKHQKIFIAKNSNKYTLDDIITILYEFNAAIKDDYSNGDKQIRHLLKKYVKHFINDNYQTA